jgi:hypothetical protein
VPAEMERLLGRIAFLEEQLLRKSSKKKNAKKSSKKKFSKRISEAILQDNVMGDVADRELQDGRRNRAGLFGGSSDEGDMDADERMRTTQSTPRDDGSREEYTRGGVGQRAGSRGRGGGSGGGGRAGGAGGYGSGRSPDSSPPRRAGGGEGGVGVGIADVRRVRPSSAPSTSARPGSSSSSGARGGARGGAGLGKVRHPSNRLYNAAITSGKVGGSAVPSGSSPSRKDRAASAGRDRGESGRPSGKDARPQSPQHEVPKKEVEPFNPAIHTYDWKSGRRILISEAQMEYEERRRNKEAMEHVLAISDAEMDALMGAGTGGGGGASGKAMSPTKAEYPSKSISGDVDKWLARMRRQRFTEKRSASGGIGGGGSGSGGSNPTEEQVLPEPRYFGGYQKLQDRDLIISIEHCYDCYLHCTTTRHKQDEYVNNASTFLRLLAQLSHECGVCARVGVTCFRANVTQHLSSDQVSRVGAFEIQVAYKQPNGKVVPAVLYSKLTSRRWPSKSVLEKRFRSFIASAKVNTSLHSTDPKFVPAETPMAKDSFAPYPVGVARWASSPVSDPLWAFSVPEPKPAAALAGTAAAAGASVTAASAEGTDGVRTDAGIDADADAGADSKGGSPGRSQKRGLAKSPGAAAGGNGGNTAAASSSSSIANVQWAFDMRDLAESPPRFAIGSTIRVHKIAFQQNCIERHSLLGVVKDYVDHEYAHNCDLIVKLLYQVQETKVPQMNCLNLHEYECEEFYEADFVPHPLEALLLLAKKHKLISWDVSKVDGRKDPNSGDILLTRKGFFNQVRKLVWSLIKKIMPSIPASANYIVTHPVSGSDVDLHYCYSESTIDWVFEAFKGEANVSALERIAAGTEKYVSPATAAANAAAALLAEEQARLVPVAAAAVVVGNTNSVSFAEANDSFKTAKTTADGNNTGTAGSAPAPSVAASSGLNAGNSVTSALTFDAAGGEGDGDDAATFKSAEPQTPGSQGKNGGSAADVASHTSLPSQVAATAASASVGSNSNSSAPPQTISAAVPQGGSKQDPSPPPAAAAAPPSVVASPADAPTPMAAPAATAAPPSSSSNINSAINHPAAATATPPVAPSTSSGKQRFSSIDLIGAADKTLKHKTITALTLPGQAHNAALSPMERVGILYSLADALLGESSSEEEGETALLPQSRFLAILGAYGLQAWMSNEAITDALLLKGKASANQPDVPVSVHLFLNWLQASDYVKKRSSSALTEGMSFFLLSFIIYFLFFIVFLLYIISTIVNYI